MAPMLPTMFLRGSIGQKTQSNQRFGDQAAGGKVAILPGDYLIEIRRQLVHLGADAAHENILKRRHLTEKNGWTILDLAIGLRQWGEDDIAIFHT